MIFLVAGIVGAVLFVLGTLHGRRTKRHRALAAMEIAFREAPMDLLSNLACIGLRLRWQLLFDSSLPASLEESQKEEGDARDR